MQLLSLWPLFFLILIPAIIILYLLKQKAQDHPFSSLYLWKETYKNIEVTTPWEKLKNNLLMYLQIITMLALIFALASPYLKTGGSNYQNIIYIVDNSASMNYLYSDNNTRLEESIQKAIKHLEDLKTGANVTIISCAANAKIEIANTQDKEEAKNKLKSIKPTDLKGDLTAGISLVKSMTKQLESYEAILFTDTKVAADELNATLINMENQAINASIDYVSNRVEDNKMTVLVKVTNHSETDFETDINLYIDEELEAVQTISLSPNENKTIYFTEIIPHGTIITAQINEKDALFEDNKAYDPIEEQTVNRILLLTEQNIFLEKAILTINNIELYKTNDIKNIDETDYYDIYIYDGITPDEFIKDSAVLIINPTDIKDLFTAETKEGAMISAVNHQVTKYLENYSFGVNEFQAIKKPVWAESFLHAGEYSTGFIGQYNGRTIAVLAFDIHQTDLPLQSEFPILINNLISECMDSKFIAKTKYTTGDNIYINSVIDGEDVIVVNPFSQTTTLPKTNSVYTDTQRAGVYSVSQKHGEETTHKTVVVNFPTEESNQNQTVENNDANNDENNQVSPDSIKGGKDLRNIILLVILILLVTEWIVYLRLT